MRRTHTPSTFCPASDVSYVIPIAQGATLSYFCFLGLALCRSEIFCLILRELLYVPALWCAQLFPPFVIACAPWLLLGIPASYLAFQTILWTYKKAMLLKQAGLGGLFAHGLPYTDSYSAYFLGSWLFPAALAFVLFSCGFSLLLTLSTVFSLSTSISAYWNVFIPHLQHNAFKAHTAPVSQSLYLAASRRRRERTYVPQFKTGQPRLARPVEEQSRSKKKLTN